MKKIKIKCGGELVPLGELEEFQGELKSLTVGNYERLRDRIVKYGFDAPLFVWGKKILDGHQRFRTVKEMVNAGWSCDVLPTVQIKAKNEVEAKKRLLGYVSQFGKLEDQGLYEFMDGIDFEEWSGEVDLPQLDIDNFKYQFIEDMDVDQFFKDEDTGTKEPKETVCPNCGHKF